MIVIGCDPGITGGLAVLDSESGGLLACVGMPTKLNKLKKTIINEGEVWHWFAAQRLMGAEHFVCEQVNGMPGQGGSRSFNFGYGYATVLMCARMLYYKVALAPKAKWAGPYGIKGGDEGKKASLLKARELFGSEIFPLEGDHNRAEAALIAHWGAYHFDWENV